MAFDYDNAVQQGFNRDVDTNDWNVEVQNIEIKLGDAGGGTEFKILDTDNVAVITGDSDGYFAVAGNAEIHGGNLLIENPSVGHTTGAGSEYITFRDADGVGDEVSIFNVHGDPNGILVGTIGSIALDHVDGYFYINNDDFTGWTRLVGEGEVGTVTLQQAYNNDVNGGDAFITTNGTDGAVVIAGTEEFRVTVAGGINLDTGFDMDGAGPFDVDITGAVSIDSDADSNFSVDGANLTFEVTSSGDIINRLESPGSDFVVDQGAGSEFLRAETSVNELRLGDLSPEQIDVRVLSDMVIDGDLTVQGTTTTVNTEDLFVEDRLMRLNVGTEPSFSGNTGIEMEVGSDGYVEFHWDDTAGRWEFSIDRNVTPEAQTFRPIPYLADSPPTLDLSDTGNDGFPTSGPNLTGAASINSNATNFPYSFGDYMADDSVQAALEAIDAYFIDISDDISNIGTTTLQIAYDNDADGGDATITTNATDGSVVIAGTESFQVTATGGIDLDSDFDQDGGSFDVNVTGAASIDADSASNFTVDTADLTLNTTTSGDVNVTAADAVDIDGTTVTADATGGISLDAGAASNFTTSVGALTLDGASGVILDGNGSNVRPAADDTDSLGTSSFGWTNVYIRNVPDGATVGLGDAGSSTAPNLLSGAHAVGTHSDNFDSFGPDMTDQSVQAALEAIDGYLLELGEDISQTNPTLQQVYDNDPDGGDATITTNATDGAVVVSGSEEFRVDATGGINLDTGFDMDSSTGDFDVDLTSGAAFHLDAYSPTSTPSVQVDSGDLLIGTTTSGVLTLEGVTGIVMDGSGEGVRPASSCTDDLGRSDAGWRDLYVCNGVGNVVALGGVGTESDLPNVTSGASAVGTSSDNFSTFGPDMTDDTVQSALEAIDGYFADLSLDDLADTFFTKEVGLPTNGAVLNGNVRVSQDGIMPALDFRKNKTGRSCWTIPVPSDWDGESSIDVEVVWSAEDSSAGDVAWRLEYLPLTSGELASGAATTVDYTQAASGTTNEIQTTDSNLTIPASAIDSGDEVIALCVVRRGTAGADTYNQDAQVHLVKYRYTAENIVE